MSRMSKRSPETREKMFIIKKYIYAKSITDAIAKDKKTPVDDCQVNENPRPQELTPAIGFNYEDEY